ncbi:MAG: phosphate-starvation-inducible PsiE family protein [Methanosarcinaceae archaeon]|nr:phosphate-starvation-inducible PsiE family protein [Methanosarcinaceae archaeon]
MLSSIKIDNVKIFENVIRFVTTFILYVLVLALILGMVKTLLDLRFLLFETLDIGFRHIVASVLTIFIVIDLFKTFVDFLERDRIKLTNVTDATILIILRELALGLYSKEFGYEFILSLSALLLVLGIIRVLAIKYSPDEHHEAYSF